MGKLADITHTIRDVSAMNIVFGIVVFSRKERICERRFFQLLEKIAPFCPGLKERLGFREGIDGLCSDLVSDAFTYLDRMQMLQQDGFSAPGSRQFLVRHDAVRVLEQHLVTHRVLPQHRRLFTILVQKFNKLT